MSVSARSKDCTHRKCFLVGKLRVPCGDAVGSNPVASTSQCQFWPMTTTV